MLSGSSIVPIAVLGLGLMISIAVLVRRWPRFGMVLWLLTIGFIPIWLGVTVKWFYFAPATVIAVVVLLFVRHRGASLRLGLADLVIAAFMVSCLMPFFTGGSTRTTIFVLITGWLVPLLLGRLIPQAVGLQWLYGAIAVVFSVVAFILLIEFFTGWNPFVTLLARGNALYSIWGTIQERGGVARAEGAFGHAIAAGSALAMAMPMTLASRFRPWLRVGMVLLMGAGVVVTVSRVSMVAAAIAIALVIFMLRSVSVRARVGMFVTFGVLAASLVPFVLTTLKSAGDEASNSASYRSWLLDLVPGITILGVSPLANRGTDGTLYFGNFASIDSQLLYTGLEYGWFALILGLIGLVAVIIVVLARRASAATIAIAGQIPALATVALITQYADFFWFVVGVALFSQATQELSLSTSVDDGVLPEHVPIESRSAHLATNGRVV